MQYLGAVFTQVMTTGEAPKNFWTVHSSEVLEAVQKLNAGDAAEEEQHRRETAQSMLALGANKGKKRELFATVSICCKS